jgi:hypothetical protein
MSEPENLTLRAMPLVDAKLDLILQKAQDVTARVASVEDQLIRVHSAMPALRSDFVRVEHRLDRFEGHLMRIERRLDLIEA